MNLRLRRVWDFTSIYLPVMLMGLLALGTWWLVRNAPKPQPAPQEVAKGHDIDYYMRDFSIRSFDDTGKLTSEIRGDTLRHFMDTETLEIDQANLRSTRANGAVTVATADRALSNADGSEVQLFGNARVVRQPTKAGAPSMEFRGDFLHAFVNEERVSSNKPVEITR
ncbi:MAG: LPS export ABC transporter periplasmic protein LptC, partial [Comamonas sp.]